MTVFKVESYTSAVTDDAKAAAAITAANAAPSNYVHTIEFAARAYYFNSSLPTINGNVWVRSEGRGRRSTFLSFKTTADNQVFIKFSGRHGGGISDCRIDCNGSAQEDNYDNVVGLHLLNCSSFTVEDFEVILNPGDAYNIGNNSVAVWLERHNSPNSGNDSLTIQKFNATAAVPVFIQNGDNIVIRDFDIHVNGPVSGNMITGGSGLTTPAVPCAFKFSNEFIPANHTIGPGSTQKGEHVIHCDSESATTGQTLYLQNIRSEQMVANASGTNAAYHFKVLNTVDSNSHGYESIEFRACRSTYGKLPSSFNIKGSLKPPVVSLSSVNVPDPTSFPSVGYYAAGSQKAVSDAVQGGNLYAANTTERDAFFAAGVWKGQQIFTDGGDTYTILKNYIGPFASATAGTHYEVL